jgi:hypothetical protein
MNVNYAPQPGFIVDGLYMCQERTDELNECFRESIRTTQSKLRPRPVSTKYSVPPNEM